MSKISVLNQQKDYRPSELAAKLIAGGEFQTLYRDVMKLVDDTANYLDGEGRAAAKSLKGVSSVAYSRHSMEVTTSCMRSASVCLALRATRQGDMRLEDALRDVMSMDVLMKPTTDVDPSLGLPQGLVDILDRSNVLQARLKTFCHSLVAQDQPAPNVVHDRLQSLRLAFENVG